MYKRQSLSLLFFSRGSAEVFQFALRDANPLTMLISQFRAVAPLSLVLLSIYLITASSDTLPKGNLSKIYEILGNLSVPILFLLLPAIYWTLIPLVIIYFFFFRYLVAKFRRENKLSKALLYILHIRMFLKSYKIYTLSTFLLFSLLINPSGAWMKTEVITKSDNKSFSAFVIEGADGIEYLSIKDRNLGSMKYDQIKSTKPCSVLADQRPWLFPFKVVESRKC